ncbi:MAG: GldG family protein [Spirochaetaceae bacterium]|jgi:ABC-type uncharacterized transport system involved in gliding motility auxiliary subunit|nr:GldG family protein [Spirochaetaceae bacterium]
MTKKQEIIITALSVVAIVLALLLSSRLWVRLDLTADKLYTISPVSRHLADEIPDQVTITYFVSAKLRQLYPQPGEIMDLIREYAAYSRGKIRAAERDPVKDGFEDDMLRLGIYPQQIQSVDRNEATVTSVYTGILIEYMEKSDVIPFVFSLETLEYDLTSRIRALVSGKTREAGIIMADYSKSFDRNYRNLAGILQMAGYKLRQIPVEVLADEGIPDGLSEIVVIGGVDSLDEAALRPIDRYIQDGGKVAFLPENFTPSTTTGALEAVPLADGGLLAMLRSYGVDVRPAFVLDKSCLTITYRSAGPGGAPLVRLVRYPFWVSVTPDGGNPAHPVTSAFSGVDLFWPNPLGLSPVDGVEAAPLLSSTADAWLMTRDFTISPDSAPLLMREQQETAGAQVLAAALSGRFPPYFNGTVIPPATPPLDGADDRQSRIIVIGNNEFLNDEYLDSERNLNFFLLAADWLANDDDIIGIRSRVSGTNRLDRIVDPQRKYAAQTAARTLNVVIIPAAVLVFAIVFALKRRRKNA